MRRGLAMVIPLLAVFLAISASIPAGGSVPDGPSGEATTHADPGITASCHEVRKPISIIGDANFTTANGVRRGSGTPADPYVIECWSIQTPTQGPPGVAVSGTNASFVVRKVDVGPNSVSECIRLTSAKNGAIENTELKGCREGIVVGWASEGITIRRNNITASVLAGVNITSSGWGTVLENNVTRNGAEGILISSPTGNGWQVTDNLVSDNRGVAVSVKAGGSAATTIVHQNTIRWNNLNRTPQGFDYGNGQWDNGQRGNWWSDLTGPDANGDAVVDVPYNISANGAARDRFPLCPPVYGCWGAPGARLESVNISPASATLKVGKSARFTATALDQTSSPISGAGFQWWFNGSAGTVDQTGLVTADAVGTGRVEVYATYKGLTRSASAEVNVIPANHTLSGLVQDPEGAPVGGATVDVIDAAISGLAASAETGPDGSFSFSLEAGRQYYLEVTYPDGERVRTDPIVLSGDSSIQVTRRPAPPSANPWWLIGLGTILGLSTLGVALLLGGEALRFALLVALISLYSKIKREQVLDHFLRGRVYQQIAATPGATFSELKRALGLANGTLTYHLYVLERAEFIRSEPSGKWKRFFPRDSPVEQGGLYLSRIQRAILDTVSQQPGLTYRDIADRLGARRRQVVYNVQRLSDLGFVSLGGGPLRRLCFPSGNEPTDHGS